MKLVYVAGPFSAATREGVEANIQRAALLGVEVAKLGAFPVVPHANTALPEYEHVQPYKFWIEGTLELMRRCHAVIMLPGWEASSGARAERFEAMARRMPVFETLSQLEYWLRTGEEQTGKGRIEPEISYIRG
jgi:hypothetical protein